MRRWYKTPLPSSSILLVKMKRVCDNQFLKGNAIRCSARCEEQRVSDEWCHCDKVPSNIGTRVIAHSLMHSRALSARSFPSQETAGYLACVCRTLLETNLPSVHYKLIFLPSLHYKLLFYLMRWPEALQYKWFKNTKLLFFVSQKEGIHVPH